MELFDELQQKVTHIFNLDAIYDLAIPEKIDRLVNVVGKDHVNEFDKGVTNLKRYTYFSTRYVAGNREGILYEHELRFPKSFKNHFERQNLRLNYLSRSLKRDSYYDNQAQYC
ncbi:SDR family oxidoreductase [Peribacillus sp. SIMBA_075]|uniref:SDR family oxidoreductase n=1 Tax=Peribacillus sp. SIMBA_075 TaxID=3085813 RepID=UPI003979225F